jgi:D-cysteine desulfhydrase family pyridoxal phosphate-dependent enzyme
MATALASLMSLPHVALANGPSPVHELPRLRAALGHGAPRLFIKRDDLLTFGLGGNKVRKLEALAAQARAAGADTLVTCGAVQSNHARVTAAAGAALGMRVVLVLSGGHDGQATGNLRLDRLFGAEVRFVADRDERDAAMAEAAGHLEAEGRRPFVIPVGGSTPAGALGFARGVAELAASGIRPDAIVHASSSGGTQAGLVAGCALLGLATRVLGVSADLPAPALRDTVRALLGGMAATLGAKPATLGLTADSALEVDDGQVGPGYGVPTPASDEAITLVARQDGVLLDPVYTAKAMAGLIASIRAGAFTPAETVLFWHTGGQPGYFA